MRTVRLIPVSMVLAAFFVISTIAQVPIKAPTKVGLVNIFALQDKGGVTRYISALAALDKEFETEIKALQTMSTNFQAKTKAFNDMRVQASQPNSPITQASLRTKNVELEQLKREAKFKQDDLQARINARRQVLVGPVWIDMMKAMKTFAQQKGYAVVLDGAKLEELAIMLAFSSQADITKNFITYYNARPAETASTNNK